MVARLDPRVVFLQNSFGDSASLGDATCREAEAKGLGFNLCDDVVWGDGLQVVWGGAAVVLGAAKS